MDKPSAIMELHTRYKKFINNNLDYIKCNDFDKKIHLLSQKYGIEHTNQYDLEFKLKKLIIQRIEDIGLNTFKGNNLQENNKDDWEIEQTVESSILLKMIKQLYLGKRLYKEELESHINIMEVLWMYVGNGYLYSIKDLDWDMLFQYAMELSFLASDLKSILRDDLEDIVKATKYLIKYGVEFEIFEGDIVLNDESHKKLHLELEKIIDKLGGFNVLEFLFKHELEPKYNARLNRYLIHRNKSTTGMDNRDPRIPYNYLINLCGKHLTEGMHTLSLLGREKGFEELIILSSSYLSVLNIQGCSVFEDVNIRYTEIPKYISDNIIFENLYIPLQYNPYIALDILENLYRILFEYSVFKGFSFNEYFKCATIILKEYEYCSIIPIQELISKTKIRKTTLIKILNEISIPKVDVNNGFDEILTHTNLFEKPLIALNNDEYFLISPYFCSYSFITVIHEVLDKWGVPGLNRQLGVKLEEFIKEKINDKGFKYYSGHYFEDSKTQGECDIVLTTSTDIVFIEVKRRGLPETFKLGDDIDVLNSLSEGMIHAQKQTFKHKNFIQRKGFIELYEEQDKSSPFTILNWNDSRIISISICLPEYGFFTNKLVSEKLLDSLRFVTYHSIDPSKEKKLLKLNEFNKDIELLLQELDEDEEESKSVFFDSLFRSLQQFLYALELSETVEEFINYLAREIHIIHGSLDFYTNLLNK